MASRPLYPYSVIPGGVESRQELKDAIAHDPVAAGHYANFDVAKVRVVRLDRDRMVYISYRMGDRVFWTSKKVKLAKSEAVITDGTHEARTRCGNRLSDTPAQPVSPTEPTPQALEQPQSPQLVAILEPAAFNFPPTPPLPRPLGSPLSPPSTPPDSPPGGGMIPPPFFPPIGGGGSLPPAVSLPVPVPEPTSLSMVVAGIAVIFAANWFTNVRRRRKA